MRFFPLVNIDGDCNASTHRRRETFITPVSIAQLGVNQKYNQKSDVETDNYPSLQSPPLAGAGGGLSPLSEGAGDGV